MIGARSSAMVFVFCVVVLQAFCVWSQEHPQKLDLNSASLRQIEQLPIPKELAEAIYNYRLYSSYFTSAYDLMQVEGMTPLILQSLIPRISTRKPPAKDEWQLRFDESFRQVQRFLGQEGSSEELADEFLDLLRQRRNVNEMSIHELQSLQNVSPVDAVAVIRARESAGRIDSQRQLRTSEGLRYWGYRNLRDYVVYTKEDVDPLELHGDIQFLTFNTPYQLDEREILFDRLSSGTDLGEITPWGIRGLDSANPAVQTKARFRLGSQFTGGVMTFRNVGEQDLNETVKGFAQWTPDGDGSLELDRVVVGNFRVAFGQGLVMDNTDFFLPRKTGFGWNIRPRGILGDLSRSQEFALRGVALEGHAGPVRGIGFFSKDKKDVIKNPDGTLNRYFVMTPRFEEDELAQFSSDSGAFIIERDGMDETMFGGLLQVELTTGTQVGISGWEASYDGNVWNPNPEAIVEASNLLGPRDSELFQSYDSRNLGDFRRVVGAEFQTVYKNVAVQGEYAKLDSNPEDGLKGMFSAAPEAYLLNAYMQYEDFDFLALWRDYDVGFDNPYARAFSEDTRFEQTLVGDFFRLHNPLLTWLEINTPQPKAEKGLYFNSRYRISRSAVASLEFDQWQREADGQDLRRYVLRMEYSPIFPLRFRLRHRISSRAEDLNTDFRAFEGWDSRLDARVRLSGFDELRFLWSITKTRFAGRPRLSEAAEGGATPLAQLASPGQAIQAMLTHNVNDRLMFTISTEMYQGFLYNFEDNEFVVLDDVGFRNWFMVRSRVSDELMMRFKITGDRNLGIDSFRGVTSVPGVMAAETGNFATSFRLQLDYTF